MCLMGQVLEHSRLNCARAPSLDQRGDVDMLIGLFCCQTVSQFFIPAAAEAAGCVAQGVF